MPHTGNAPLKSGHTDKTFLNWVKREAGIHTPNMVPLTCSELKEKV
jgi:hypothetical protein